MHTTGQSAVLRKFGCSAEVVRTPTPAEEGLLTGMYMEGLAGDYKTPDTMFISTPSENGFLLTYVSK